jgi:hypothetical protein
MCERGEPREVTGGEYSDPVDRSMDRTRNSMR